MYRGYRPVARLGIEGGQDIFQAGPDMFVTLSKRFSNIFLGGSRIFLGAGTPFTPPWLRACEHNLSPFLVLTPPYLILSILDKQPTMAMQVEPIIWLLAIFRDINQIYRNSKLFFWFWALLWTPRSLSRGCEEI